jgi:hypothetical protein
MNPQHYHYTPHTSHPRRRRQGPLHTTWRSRHRRCRPPTPSSSATTAILAITGLVVAWCGLPPPSSSPLLSTIFSAPQTTGGINCSRGIKNLFVTGWCFWNQYILLSHGTINTTPSDPTHALSLIFFLFGLVFPMRSYSTSRGGSESARTNARARNKCPVCITWISESAGRAPV